MENSKSKMAAGLLGIFLGSFGGHNFYLGNTKRAVLQLVLQIVGQIGVWGNFLLGTLTIAFGIGIVFYLLEIIFLPLCWGIAIWGLVEAIMIFCDKINTDAKGNPLV